MRAPESSTTSTVTVAAVVSANEIVVRSPEPSSFGVRAPGAASRRRTTSRGGPGIESVHGRTPEPAAIVEVKRPKGVALASHVQSTALPDPFPRATRTPSASLIATVQGSEVESRPVTRTGPPSSPATSGS
jgi:hypothetical protein